MNRRKFLQNATGAAIAATTPALHAALTPMHSDKMIGIQVGAVSFSMKA